LSNNLVSIKHVNPARQAQLFQRLDLVWSKMQEMLFLQRTLTENKIEKGTWHIFELFNYIGESFSWTPSEFATIRDIVV